MTNAHRSNAARVGAANRRAPTFFDVCFEHDSTPRFILDEDGRIVFANLQGRELVASGAVGSGGMLLCATHSDRPRLSQAITRVSQGWSTHMRVLVRGHDDAWSMVELMGAQQLYGHVAAAMRRMSPLTEVQIEPVRAVFGLTPAETQVLLHLVFGDAPKEVARSLSMSVHTVRTHLRSIFSKMGVRGITGALRLTLQLAL